MAMAAMPIISILEKKNSMRGSACYGGDANNRGGDDGDEEDENPFKHV